jgi:N-acetylglucosamine-6-sulfatase
MVQEWVMVSVYLWMVMVASGQLSQPVRQPNVLVILCDDLRWDHLGCAGHPFIKTPHIDRLAREGVRFANAFCTTSLCSPSRASILSGRYAHQHGVNDNFTEFPADLPSFPKALRQAGYQTAYFGKYHMGENNDGPRPGFDTFVTHKGQGKYFDTEWNLSGKERKVIPGYYTTVVTDLAQDWLKDRPADKPWLLFLGHKAPHSFYTPEPRYAKVFDGVDIRYPASAFQLDDKPAWFKDRLDTWHGIYGPLFEFRKRFPDRSAAAEKDFAAMIRAYSATILSVDDSVGRMMDTLRKRGELDNTLVLFMGDNGLLNGEHGMVDKRTMHEPSIRIPVIARHPCLGERKVEKGLTLTVDIAPTILEMCGVDALPGTQGRSWGKLVTVGDPAWRQSFAYVYNYEKQFPYTPNVRGVRTRTHKYIHYPHGDGKPDRHLAELYDLAADPGESRNLITSKDHQTVLQDLRAELARLEKEIGLPDTMPLDQGIGKALPDQAIR